MCVNYIGSTGGGEVGRGWGLIWVGGKGLLAWKGRVWGRQYRWCKEQLGKWKVGVERVHLLTTPLLRHIKHPT